MLHQQKIPSLHPFSGLLSTAIRCLSKQENKKRKRGAKLPECYCNQAERDWEMIQVPQNLSSSCPPPWSRIKLEERETDQKTEKKYLCLDRNIWEVPLNTRLYLGVSIFWETADSGQKTIIQEGLLQISLSTCMYRSSMQEAGIWTVIAIIYLLQALSMHLDYFFFLSQPPVHKNSPVKSILRCFC